MRRENYQAWTRSLSFLYSLLHMLSILNDLVTNLFVQIRFVVDSTISIKTGDSSCLKPASVKPNPQIRSPKYQS